MKIFISWSGERSHQVAIALREWLPFVIQALDPWISSSDIEKGSRWGSEIAKQLDASRVGIICLTPENLTSEWVLFETGALSKTLESTYVCPYLYDLEPSLVRQPLGQFQATRANANDTRTLIHVLNERLATPVSRQILDRNFDQWWPELERKLASIPPLESASPQGPQKRSDRDLLEELLELVRSHERTLQSVQARFSDTSAEFGLGTAPQAFTTYEYPVLMLTGDKATAEAIYSEIPIYPWLMPKEPLRRYHQGQLDGWTFSVLSPLDRAGVKASIRSRPSAPDVEIWVSIGEPVSPIG